jgi:hypothetical protein
MQYMVIEHFRGGAPAVYARMRERGRMLPDGLHYVCGWVDAGLEGCWQVMETHDPALLERWMQGWRDLVDFQVREVVSPGEAARLMEPDPRPDA